MKRQLLLTLAIIFVSLIKVFPQKSSPNKPSITKAVLHSSAGCPLSVNIQDNTPSATCSELLKTLVAVTSACTDTNAVTYRWSSSVGGVFSTLRTTTFNLPEFLVATPVTFTVWVKEGSDSLSANYTITVKPRPNRPTLTPIGTVILCDNNPITLTSSTCTGASTNVWSNGVTGMTSISVPAIGGTYFKVACEKNGCVSDSTAAVALITGIATQAPTTTSKTICEGTVITAGNGLQAQLQNCAAGLSGTYTYTGGTVGYDDGYRATNTVDPFVVVPTITNSIQKISVSITWKKQKGGFQDDCGVGDFLYWPFHSETQFRLKSPSGKIVTLVYAGSYGGLDNPTVTTVFEDGASPINYYSPPVSGTFAPAQPLSNYIGENPSGTWTLLPYDTFWRDPLCVSGFSITFTTPQVGTITWWDAPAGGNQVGTGTEFIPSVTAAGTYTYFAQGQCARGCPSPRTASIFTIKPTPSAPTVSINVPIVNGSRSICYGEPVTLTASGCNNGNTVKWSSNYYGTDFVSGDTYTFTPVGSNSSNTNLTFTAVCDGSNLCRSTNSSTINLTVKYKPQSPTISGGGTSICVNSIVTLFASGCSGGTVGWTGNRSGSSISFNLASTVSIKAACTINGCTSDSSSAYVITTLPRPSTPSVNASQIQAICIGGSVNLSANCANGTTAKWTGGLTGSPVTITPTSTRNYKASCLGSNGCASDSSTALTITVLPKTKPVITGNAFVCGVSATTLTATGCSGVNETVMWRDESTGATFTETISQTKTFRAVCIRNGYCVSDSSDIFTVQYRVRPSQPTITPPSNTTVCQGTSVILTSSVCTGGTLGWTGGLIGQTITIAPNSTKNYKVACTINGCTSDSSNAVLITVNPKPLQPVINQISPSVCFGQSVNLSVTPINGANYAWTGGLNGSSILISPIVSKTYKVASTINGCVSDSSSIFVSVNVLPSAPSITLGGEVCTNTLPSAIWNVAITSTIGQQTAQLNTNDGGIFIVIQANPKVTISKMNSSGSIVWSRILNVDTSLGNPYINTAINTADGGFLLGGYISSYAASVDANFLSKTNSGGIPTADYWILKVDANGGTQWSKNFGGNGDDKLMRLENTGDGNYLLVGTTNSTLSYDVSANGNTTDYWIVKVNSNGNILWDKRYSPSNNNAANLQDIKSLKRTNDGGFALAMTISATVPNPNNSYSNWAFNLAKFNSSGNLSWEKTLFSSPTGYNRLSTLNSMEYTSDNNFLLVGRAYGAINNVTVIKADGNGAKLWEKVFIGGSSVNGDGGYNALVKTIPNESNFLLISETGEGVGGDKSEDGLGKWLIKLKSDGTKIWDKTFNQYQRNYGGGGLTVDSEGTIVVGGTTFFATVPMLYSKVASSCPITSLTSICKGDSVLLKSNNCSGSLTWSNGLQGSSIFVKPLTTTNYTATCTNTNGCISPLSSVFTVMVSTPPTPLITPPVNNTICQGATTTLSATGCSGGTFAWTGGLTGSSITVSPSSTRAYKVVCNLNTCTSDSSLAVTINVTPAPLFNLNSNKTSICSGDSTTLTVLGCMGSILWSTGATTSIIKVSPGANTTYTAICSVGSCSSNQSVTITALSTPNVAASGILQCGQTVTLTANNIPSGSNIQWRKDGIDIVGATNATLVVNSAGGYDFTSYNFQYLSTGEISPIQVLYFIDKNTGFAIKGTKVLKTSNGGVTWTTVYSVSYGPDFASRDITFTSPTTGWLVGDSGFCLKSVDGGSSWIPAGIKAGAFFKKIAFKDINNGIVVGESGEILYTNNAGESWTQAPNLPSASATTYSGISFVPNTSNIYVIGARGGGGVVAKSTNNGVTWSEVSLNISQIPYNTVFNDIAFTDSNNGYIVGDNGVILRTTNGGVSWQLQSNTVSSSFKEVQFLNSQVGYICGTFPNGSLLKTIDGGNTWKSLNMTAYPVSLSFVDENTGWITNYGNIIKYTSPQCPTIPAILPNNCCNGLETLKSGSWTDPTTWSCNRVPTSADDVFINTGHTITDSGNILRAKTLNYRGGVLKISNTSNLRLVNP